MIAPKGHQPPVLVVKTDPDRWVIYAPVGAAYTARGLRHGLQIRLLEGIHERVHSFDRLSELSARVRAGLARILAGLKGPTPS